MPASALLLQQAGTATVALARIVAASSSSSQLLQRGGMRSRNFWQVLRSDDDGISIPLAKAKGAVSSSSKVRNGVQKGVVSLHASRKPKQQHVERVRSRNNKSVNVEAEGTAVTDESTDKDQEILSHTHRM